MILVTKETLAVLLGPARVTVLLAQLGGFLLPRRWCLSSLHGFGLVTAVALLRHRHDRGVNHLPAPRDISLRLKISIEAFEQLLNQRSLGELFAEQPQCGRIGNAV